MEDSIYICQIYKKKIQSYIVNYNLLRQIIGLLFFVVEEVEKNARFTCVVESLRVESNGCVGVLLTFGEPTGLELPEVEVPGSGRLLPAVGEIAGGVTEDMTMVGGFMDASRFIPNLFSVAVFASTLKVDEVDTIVEVLIVTILDSVAAATDVFPSTVNDVAVIIDIVVFVSMEGPVCCVLVSVLLDLSLLSELL